MAPKTDINRRRLSPRASLRLAILLVAIGFLRFVTDTLHEFDVHYWTRLDGTWLRYLARAPSDGTVPGYLNAQWFKVFAIPSGISLIYLRCRCDPGTLASNQAEFHDWAVRGVWITVFFLGFTAIELEKQLGILHMSAHLVAGEDPVVNHLAHGIGAVVSWKLAGGFTMTGEGEGA